VHEVVDELHGRVHLLPTLVQPVVDSFQIPMDLLELRVRSNLRLQLPNHVHKVLLEALHRIDLSD